MRSLFRLDIHIIYSEFISQSSNDTVRDNSKKVATIYIYNYKYIPHIVSLFGALFV